MSEKSVSSCGEQHAPERCAELEQPSGTITTEDVAEETGLTREAAKDVSEPPSKRTRLGPFLTAAAAAAMGVEATTPAAAHVASEGTGAFLDQRRPTGEPLSSAFQTTPAPKQEILFLPVQMRQINAK